MSKRTAALVAVVMSVSHEQKYNLTFVLATVYVYRWLVLRPQVDGLPVAKEQEGTESNSAGIIY